MIEIKRAKSCICGIDVELITNFSKSELDKMYESINEYNNITNEIVLMVGKASNTFCEYGLWIITSECRNLSGFWNIYYNK